MSSSTRLVACPKCGAGNGEPCRTLATNRVTDHHIPRIEKAHEYRRALSLSPADPTEEDA